MQERPCLLKKDLVEGQITKIQDNHSMTIEATDDSRITRRVHRKKQPCPLKKEPAEGQLSKAQDKHSMTMESTDDKRLTRQVHRE